MSCFFIDFTVVCFGVDFFLSDAQQTLHEVYDMDDDCNDAFVPVTVNVDAAVSEAEDRGYRRGLKEGQEQGFKEGYRECGHDIVERLRTTEEFNTEEYKSCLLEIERMLQ